jgi:uncharacterized membrane protein
MTQKVRQMVRAAVIGALYVVLTHLQNLIFPNSASMAIQFRASEALCVLAFFTPAAIPGLTVGCLLFNLTFIGSLPLDFLVGTLATLGATASMRLLRRLPFLGLLMPALWNAFLVGWELSIYIGGAFWVNALCVAIGEMIALLIPGMLLWGLLNRKDLGNRLFA